MARYLVPVGTSDSNSSGGENHRHLTIAFDESGNFDKDRYSAIGGVIIEAIDDNGGDAQNNVKKFLEALRNKGVHFYDHVPAYTELEEVGELVTRPCVDKGSDVGNRIAHVKGDHECIQLGAFRCLIGSTYQDQNQLGSDSTYLTWLRATLDLLLSEYLPSCGYDLNTTSLSIWLPTRVVVPKWELADGRTEVVRKKMNEVAEKNAKKRLADEAMRLDFDYHENRMQTIGGKSVAYTMIRAALGKRQSAGAVVNAITSLKLRKIPYYRDGEGRYVSAINWYCAECRDYSGGVPKSSGERLRIRDTSTRSRRHTRPIRTRPSTRGTVCEVKFRTLPEGSYPPVEIPLRERGHPWCSVHSDEYLQQITVLRNI